MPTIEYVPDDHRKEANRPTSKKERKRTRKPKNDLALASLCKDLLPDL